MGHEEVNTAVAHITGTVLFFGFPPRAHTPDVTIIARSDRKTVRSTINPPAEGGPYTLAVSPGEWSVHAVLGSSIESEHKTVMLKAGDNQVIDFDFGESW